MYLLVGILAIIIGVILSITAKKIAKNKSGLAIGVRIIGVCLMVTGFAILYLLLSGKLILPLSTS